MSKKNPNPIDCHVGSRVRMQRMVAGISQERLGSALGVTFQQIQKYEKGSNRISASRLQQIADLLKTDVAFFFHGMSQPARALEQARNANPEAVLEFTMTSQGVQLNKAFAKIKDQNVRRRLVDLAEVLAEEGQKDGS
ncbi:helix-turn-helix domain-containing protein [Bosea sp. NPDC055332]